MNKPNNPRMWTRMLLYCAIVNAGVGLADIIDFWSSGCNWWYALASALPCVATGWTYTHWRKARRFDRAIDTFDRHFAQALTCQSLPAMSCHLDQVEAALADMNHTR